MSQAREYQHNILYFAKIVPNDVGHTTFEKPLLQDLVSILNVLGGVVKSATPIEISSYLNSFLELKL